ncbi:MAG: TlpA family protein disulfide reductase [Nitrospirae bacterium]|nr:TlpA family protein disulfide reductase [Nitrospirota bacterium]
MNKGYFLLLFIVLGLVATACSKKDSKSAESQSAVGSSAELSTVAPDFTLKDLTGKNISLSDYKGRVILLEFWATWCPPCKASVPILVELKKKYEQRGFIVIGVSIDTDSDASDIVRQFSASYNINYPVVMADEMIQKKYNIISVPTSFLIGKDGKIVDIYKGYSEELDGKLSAQIEALL